MSVDKLLNDLGQVLEEVKASAADKKGDEGQMVALYGKFPLCILGVTDIQEWDKQALDLMWLAKQQRSSWIPCTSRRVRCFDHMQILYTSLKFLMLDVTYFSYMVSPISLRGILLRTRLPCDKVLAPHS